MHTDLLGTLQQLRHGATDACREMAQAVAIASSPVCQDAFTDTFFAATQDRAKQADLRGTLLAGLSVSVKDLFDLAGQVTTAGSTVLEGTPAAKVDAPAVRRLLAAGATVIGRTQMSEFAFSGVGVNPHHGTPRNVADSGTARVPGGSSSGAAVSVAAGAAFIGLGSDTGGSIRIPAALNGIVGFKSTARLVPTAGALPLSTTLDTVCAITRSVGDAMLAHEILAARRITRSPAALSAYQLAVVRPLFCDGLDATVSQALERSLAALTQAGARIRELPLPPLTQLRDLYQGGGFAAAESNHWHRHWLQKRGQDYDPRVRVRIERGASMSACEYLELQQLRRKWITATEASLSGVDAVLSPTTPLVAPTLASVAPGNAQDEEFFRINQLLLRNPSVVNMLDGCAITLPCHQGTELPVGLMIWGPALADDRILNIALQAEKILKR